MDKEPQTSQTQFLLAITVAAIVGALVGSVTSSFFLLKNNATVNSNGLSYKDVDPKVVQLIEEESATISVVDDVAPSVVSIVVKKPRGQLSQSAYDKTLFYQFFYDGETLTEEESNELVEVASGTGFFVTEDGLILTNRHVVDQTSATYIVVDNNGTEYEAKFVDADPFQDIALLKVEGTGFHAAKLGISQNIRIGQTVIAIGNTLSEFRNTVTKGVVSGIDRRVTAASEQNAEVIEKAIQTDAAINPGNSGGPLINLLAEVIGINTAISSQGESIGFAIPIDQAKRAIDDVVAYGRIIRPWLGVRYVLVEPEPIPDLSLTYELGALIASGNVPGQVAVFDGSPAEKAGLKEGDVIIAINNNNLTHASALSERVSEFHPGDVIKITFLRNGVIEEVDLTLVEFTK